MKVKLGGSASMKFQLFQYEPIEVTSSLEVEETFENSEQAEEWLQGQSERINESLKMDLERKSKIVAKNHSDLRKKLKEMV